MTHLTQPQYTALKAAINADQALVAAAGIGDFPAIKIAMEQVASPTFTVWRTNVSRAEIYHQTSAEGTTWSWTIYKGQTQGEQGAWTQMFMGDQSDFSLPNLRTAVENIFGAANAQTVHCKAIAKRSATRTEKALASGVGSLATPATMTVQGSLEADEYRLAWVQG